MNDGSHVFTALKKSLSGLFPKMEGHQASHFGTFLHMITGMVVSKHCHLPKISGKIQSPIKQESQIAKFKRLLSNKSVNGDIYFLPFLKKILPVLTGAEINLIFDGSVMGKDSACLMASITYKNRAIPIAWLVVEGRKGHFTEAYHIELLEIVKSIFPESKNITVIGDGEFDGVYFLETIESYDWSFVVRTARNAKFTKKGYPLNLPRKLKPGESKFISNTDFTQDYYGPVNVLVCQLDNKKETLFLITNHHSSCITKQIYKQRQKIETFFSDLKTKGFYLHKSHISDLKRLGNLMISACIGYIWVVLLGEYSLYKGINAIFHRTERCDLSLLQLGFRYIEHMINNNLKFPSINFLDYR